MEYLIGVVLAAAGLGLAAVVGLARERAFHSTIMIWIACNYVLFALMGGGRTTLVLDSLFAAVFFTAALIGFRSTLWIVVVALVGHGLFDRVHHLLVSNPGVPTWWPRLLPVLRHHRRSDTGVPPVDEPSVFCHACRPNRQQVRGNGRIVDRRPIMRLHPGE